MSFPTSHFSPRPWCRHTATVPNLLAAAATASPATSSRGQPPLGSKEAKKRKRSPPKNPKKITSMCALWLFSNRKNHLQSYILPIFFPKIRILQKIFFPFVASSFPSPAKLPTPRWRSTNPRYSPTSPSAPSVWETRRREMVFNLCALICARVFWGWGFGGWVVLWLC